MSENRPKNPVPRPGDRIRAKRSAKMQFAQATLILEAFVILFATLVVNTLRSVPSVWQGDPPTAARVWIAGGALVLILILISRYAGTSTGDIAGSAVQVPILLSALVVPMMVVLGIVFTVIWILSLWVGGRIDRERAAYDAANPDTAPNV
ncbi:hypothetical protein GCM10010401_01470 [Rarobacter faecitabidus]|uniref:Uncharacterized protein DUF4233 n=1 Tax=Rarobacter faecitabidus TaxID=13243 RepID=A0A542ZWJ2_RARFA|nr:DUF4233 domain-containing protein [Rarobacter faecitabidus]TQL64718.1 uncharacterized protein DUF4233 [Rarobacter faecitabidus]